MSYPILKRSFAFFLALIFAGAGMLYVRLTHDGKVFARPASADSSPPLQISQLLDTNHGNPVYAHSIVEGGVHSVDELLEILRTDPEVAAHYKNFDVAKAHIVKLDHPLIAYLSYRIDGKGIYWTVHPISIPANEPLLTDGNTYIRTRCGNVIASNPMTPTNRSNEPSDLDTVVAPSSPPIQESGPSDESFSEFTEPSPTIGEFLPESPDSPQSDATPSLSTPIPSLVSSSFPLGGGCSSCIFPQPPPPQSSLPVAPIPEPNSLVLLLAGIGTIPIFRVWTKRTSRISRLKD